MADLTLSERLQPSLLDRLTDDAPESREEARKDRVIDIKRLRDIIQRDLAWLLNTTNFESEFDPELMPHVAQSTVNYGMPDITGKPSTVQRTVEIRNSIRRAIETFEPRILPDSLHVEFHEERKDEGAIISFNIQGDLWAQPVPIEIYMRTALDVTTGEVTLNRQG